MAKELQQTYRMIKAKEGEGNKGRIRIESPKRKPSTLFNGKSIKKTKNIEDSKSGSYDCFAISYLIDDLFHGNEYVKDYNTSPIINFTNIPKAGKDKLSFFLPKEIFSYIEKKRSSNPSREDYYGHFFQLKYSDNFISNYIYDYYTEIGWNKFIEKVQTHIVNKFADVDLSSNEELINYLSSVGDDTIVSKSKSPKANSAFSKLVEGGKSGNSENLALIIANFFISCFLGLRSMNCKVESYKMYLLSEYGMECIWRPDLITPPHERIDEARQMYKCGSYTLSYKIGKQWLSEYETRANKEELAIAYQILGSSLYKLASSNSREYKGKQSEGIEYLEKCIETGVADLSVPYTLYEQLKEDDEETAAKYLKTAFAQNYAKAIIEVTFLYLNDTLILDDVSEELLLEKINYIIENERRNDVVDVGNCLYLRGRLAKKHGNEFKANKDFEAASKRGNERARQEIARKKRNERNSFPSFINDKNAPCCYTNTFTGNNYTVLSTFPSKTWVVYTPDDTDKEGVIEVQSLEVFIEMQNRSGFGHSKLAFFLMSDDEEKNLNECLILLDKLFNIVLDKSKEEKWKIVDAIDIFVGAKYETASMMIDANISDMGKDIYFKVHITDEARDTVHKLLCDAPLFLPALNGVKEEKFTKVVLFGDSEINYSFIKESIACAYLGEKHPIDITLISKNAEALENRFRQECPGVYCDSPVISCIRPQFIKCSITDTDFPSCIYGRIHDRVLDEEEQSENSSDVAMVNALLEANYFVVDYSDDLENIKFASELRTWLLRSRGTFERVPFIAVKCSDEQNSNLASHLTLSGQTAGNSYFNKHDLFPIGVSAQTYSYENLIYNPVLNDFALRIHKSYYEDNERAAENDFYSYSYNSDSSLSTAIGLCYRFFAAGVMLENKENYQEFGFYNTQNIESKFERMYKEKLEDLSSLEQSRWNGFMLSRGWESANSSQVQAYKEQSTGFAHKHILAKKHPFIREWEDLNDPDLERVLGILKSKFNYDRKPQVTTRKSIKDTSKFFRTKFKEKEIMR